MVRVPYYKIIGMLSALLVLPAPVWAAEKPQYLPPLAPTVDASVNQPRPSSGALSPSLAPQPSYTASEPPDSAPERTKDLLREALQQHGLQNDHAAEKLFRQVLAIDPNNTDANFNLGAMYEDRGDLSSALRFYQTVARANPSDSEARDAVNAVQGKLKQQQQNQQTASQLQQKQRLRQVAQQAAQAYKDGRYDQAITGLQQVVQAEPNDPNALFGLGQAYRGKGDKTRARQYLNQALAIAPSNQLYRATLNEMNGEGGGSSAPSTPASGGGHGSITFDPGVDGPRPAPDWRSAKRPFLSGEETFNSNSDPGQLTPFTGQDLASSQQPAGELTPFTNDGDPALYGHARSSGMAEMGGMGMGMGLGSALGMGMLSSGLSRMAYGGSYYSGRGTRLMRGAVMGSLAGAAVGALTNMRGPGGVRAGAMRGGLSGGLMGLMSGW